MNGMEIQYCGDLLTGVGEELLSEFAQGVHACSVETMKLRFNKANTSALKRIEHALSLRFPHIQWLDHEFDANRNDVMRKGYYWLCDPIDGALNFLQGIPYWSLSLCLFHDGNPQLSWIYDPCRKELFHAEAGKGAFLNGTQMKVLDTADLSDSILATAHPTFVQSEKEDTLRTAKDICDILPIARAVRIMGAVSLQLAYVAAGRFDGYWEHGFDLYDWWAGALMVHEAGGVVTDTRSNQLTWGAKGIIATNSILYPQLKAGIFHSVSH